MNEHNLTGLPAKMEGQAQRIPALLKAKEACLSATIQITRAATGLVETYELVGTTESQTDAAGASLPDTPDAQPQGL